MEINHLAQQYIYWPEVENKYQKNIDISNTPMKELHSVIKDTSEKDKVQVSDSIVRFYTLNEVLAKMRKDENEILDANALNIYAKYKEEIDDLSKKMFVYVFTICMMEARHCRDFSNLSEQIDEVKNELEGTDEFPFTSAGYEKLEIVAKEKVKEARNTYLKDNYAQYFKDEAEFDRFKMFHSGIQKLANLKDYDRDDVQAEFIPLLEKEGMGDLSVGEMLSFVRSIFTVNNFSSSSYGGRAWSGIAEHALKFVQGELNAEIFVDQAFSLEHNGGQIFNKDTIFSSEGSKRWYNYNIVDGYTNDSRIKNEQILLNAQHQGQLLSIFKQSALFEEIDYYKTNDFLEEIKSLKLIPEKVANELNKNHFEGIQNNVNNFREISEEFKRRNAEFMQFIQPYVDSAENINSFDILNNVRIGRNDTLEISENQKPFHTLIDYYNVNTKDSYKFTKRDIDNEELKGIINKIPLNDIIQKISELAQEKGYNFYATDLFQETWQSEGMFNKSTYKISDGKISAKRSSSHGEEIISKSVDTNSYNFLYHYLQEENLHTTVNSKFMEKWYKNNLAPKEEAIIAAPIKEFSFDYLNTKKIPEDKKTKEILGNKAYNLAMMQDSGLPVPRANVFPATNAHSFFNYPEQWNKSLRGALKSLEEEFKDSKGNAVLCSVRSGSAVSMPGMMDTILNVGIDDTNYDYFCKKLGKKVTNECATKFMHLFTKSYFGENVDFSANFKKAVFQFRQVLDKHNVEQNFKTLFPLNAQQQYKMCLHAVFKSWHSERATAYRNHQHISHDIGTAAIVQEMVFGNLNDKSCTGVAFSRDCINGNKGIIGEFLVKAQGEDVVSGAVTPTNIKEMKNLFPDAYKELITICEKLEKDTGDIQDIEFTVENNKLYILQKRKAVCSSIAQTKLSQELLELGLIDKEQLLSAIKIETLLPQDMVDIGTKSPEAKGLVANPGVMRGIVVHNEGDMEHYAELYQQHKNEKNFGWIFYAPETSPDHAPIMIKTQAFITGNGGFTSHAAILARSWKKPCVVGIGEAPELLTTPGSMVTLDATNGKIYKDILPLSTNDNKHVKEIVDLLLEHYKVDLESVRGEDPFARALKAINEDKTWMDSLSKSKYIEDKTLTKHFLDIGSKVAIMLLKNNMKKDSSMRLAM